MVAAVLPFGRSVPYLVGSRLRSSPSLLRFFLSQGQIARFDCLLRPRNGHRAGESLFLTLSVDEGTLKVFSLRSSVEEVKERGLKAQT